MGYDAWVSLTHAPLTKEQWELVLREVEKKLPPGLYYNEETGFVEAEDRLHNPDLDDVTAVAEAIASVTEMPVEIYWDDDEGDFSRIVLPDGRTFDEIRLFKTDEGTVETFTEYLDRKMTKKVLQLTENWSDEQIAEFNSKTFRVGKREFIVFIDRNTHAVLFYTPEGDTAYLYTVEKVALWKQVMDEIRKMGGEEQ